LSQEPNSTRVLASILLGEGATGIADLHVSFREVQNLLRNRMIERLERLGMGERRSAGHSGNTTGGHRGFE
jgi:hypothetical protein